MVARFPWHIAVDDDSIFLCLCREAAELLAQSSRFGNGVGADGTTIGRRTRQRLVSEVPSSNGEICTRRHAAPGHMDVLILMQ